MKKIKTFVTMFAAFAALILLPNISALKASAAEPTTFYIDYDPDGYGWYVLLESDPTKREDETPKVLQVYYNLVKDGDVVVVSNYHENVPQLDLGTARLGNVTVINNTSFTMVKAASITDFFALGNSFCSISAPVTNAYVYDPSVVNFNDNVQKLVINVDEAASTSSLGCVGTLDHLMVLFTSNNSSYNLYNFNKGTFSFEDGVVTTASYNFTTYPAPTPSPKPTPAPVTPPGGYKLKEVFDEKFYADRYPDLKAAYGYNREALWTHFITCGINEGRAMNNLLDVVKYKNTYADLNAAFGNNWDAYLEHYLTTGAKEGRDSGTGFNALVYASEYADLQRIYGDDVLALWKHYNTAGKAEGR